MLLEAKADVDFVGPLDTSPLKLASRFDDMSMMQALIQANADVNKTDKHHSQTPLHAACAIGSTATVSMLLNNNANPDVPDVYGHKPLHYANLRGEEGMVALLNTMTD